jgi:predicted transcriptional regulator
MICLVRLSDLRIKRSENKNRGRLEIVRDMLSVATERIKKTRIMYQANLSYRLMEKYLSDLLDSGLLECDEDCFYMVTWKGKEFLQMYDDYVEQCRRIGDEIRGIRKDKLLLENMCFNDLNDPERVLREKWGQRMRL